MQHPHCRWEGFRGHPWVSGSPKPERARGQEPADKAGNGEKTLKPLLGETRVTGRKLNCLKSNPIRSMDSLWLQRLREKMGTDLFLRVCAWAEERMDQRQLIRTFPRLTTQWSRRPTASAPASLRLLGAAHRER
ncbi:MAG: hypothetical protein A3G93_08990 [Nitrospinae bacterium RIFCSPLOWO2_12_FULL_45_22]|nr:MAG: hypothetical protein A3G93_08990 [Nitrospinae bacterium RIFCSPLOWO2_12_FULL_45_22]